MGDLLDRYRVIRQIDRWKEEHPDQPPPPELVAEKERIETKWRRERESRRFVPIAMLDPTKTERN